MAFIFFLRELGVENKWEVICLNVTGKTGLGMEMI